MRWLGGWRWAFIRTHSPGLATHKQEGNPNFRGPPQRVSDLSPMLGTHLGALLCEDEPGTWALKPVGLTLESQRARGNRGSTLGGHKQNLVCIKTDR